MDEQEASALLALELEQWRRWPYAELARRVDGEPVTGHVVGRSGASYQFEIQVIWDGRPGEDVRVLGAIDDGGVRAFLPLPADFIMAPNGSFVGEDLA